MCRKENWPRKILLAWLFIGFLLGFLIYAQEAAADFDPEQWDLSSARKVEFLGKPALMGIATLKDLEFKNGVIEVDIAVPQDARAYPGIFFRAQTLKNCERVYVRPHRAPFYNDSLQYTPEINGISGWQLWNGEGNTALITIPADQWLPLKVEVIGNQARVFFNDDQKPVMTIYELRGVTEKGSIGVWGLGPCYFSNFRYKVDDKLSFPPVPKEEKIPGIIAEWEISESFKAGEVELDQYPGKAAMASYTWQKVTSGPTGLVDVSRYYGMEREPVCIYAKAIIESDKDQRKQYDFGYCDVVSIFLNGEPLFMGNSIYQSRDQSFLGIIGYNDSVFLPLKKGKNELVFALAEYFGGWAFMCRESGAEFEKEGLKKKWVIEGGVRFPESAVYDKKRDIVYVSSFDVYGTPGQQTIARVTLDGKIMDPKWVTGLALPTGMIIRDDRLFIVERRNVAEIDLESGKILNRLPLPQPGNDIAMDEMSNLYVSDSNNGAVFKTVDGKFVEWLKADEIGGANGLLVIKKELIVGSSKNHSIVGVDLENKAVREIARFREGVMDGIDLDENGNLLISVYQGRVYRISPDGEKTLLLYLPDTRTADFDYIPGKKMFIIPTLENSTVMAYAY